jgi:transcriptional regulator with PAS, ATPase and Fis domain
LNGGKELKQVLSLKSTNAVIPLDLLSQDIIACSEKMQEVVRKVKQVALVDCIVLLTGETGVGKGVIAKLLHAMSSRKEGPFVQVNCGAIPDALLESELFGYENGAFTGARREGKPGKFELADNGTIFLDEIGDLPFNLQSKLLHVMQEGELTRVGGTKPRVIKARTVAATNCNLWQMVLEGKFREDLYFRLNVIPLDIPPLRERKDDIIPMVLFYKKKFAKKFGFKKMCSLDVLQFFCDYDWPGNVRELKNTIERIFVMAPPEKTITKEQIIRYYLSADWKSRQQANVRVSCIRPLKEVVEEAETQLISLALERFGTLTRAAKVLEVDTATLSRKAQKLGINHYHRQREERLRS